MFVERTQHDAAATFAGLAVGAIAEPLGAGFGFLMGSPQVVTLVELPGPSPCAA
jgi:hypothetical protein